MYFSRLEVVADPDQGRDAAQLAERAVAEIQGDFGVTLDGSAQSLDAVDGLLAKLDVDELEADRRDQLTKLLGAYVGEVMRRELGGYWGNAHQFSERMRGALALGEARLAWWPEREVGKRMGGASSATLSVRLANIHDWIATAGSSSAQLYVLRHDQGYFEAGTIADGRQILAGQFDDAFYALAFDTTGQLVEVLSHPTTSDGDDGLRAWIDTLGFRPHPIRVQRFEVEDLGVGIEDLPDSFATFAADPHSEPDPDERVERARSLLSWQAEGNFVLYWGNDLWLNADGEVESS